MLRVHDKIRANLDRIPPGIPEPLMVGRGINDVAIVTLTLSPHRKRPRAGATRTSTTRRSSCRPNWPRSRMSA